MSTLEKFDEATFAVALAQHGASLDGRAVALRPGTGIAWPRSSDARARHHAAAAVLETSRLAATLDKIAGDPRLSEQARREDATAAYVGAAAAVAKTQVAITTEAEQAEQAIARAITPHMPARDDLGALLRDRESRDVLRALPREDRQRAIAADPELAASVLRGPRVGFDAADLDIARATRVELLRRGAEFVAAETRLAALREAAATAEQAAAAAQALTDRIAPPKPAPTVRRAA